MILLCLLRNIGLFLPVLLPTFAVDSAGPSQLSSSWDTQIAESSSTSAAAATTVASASDVDAFDLPIAAKTNKTALFFSYIELSSTDDETNETLPSVDVKIEDCIDALRLQMIIQTRMIHSHHHSHNIIRINRMWSRQKFHQLVLLPH